MYGVCLLRYILSKHSSLRHPCVKRRRKGQVTTNAPRKSHHVRPHVLMLTFHLTYAHRTLYESKGLEFDDVSFVSPQFTLLPTKPRSYYTTSSRIPRQT